MEEQNNKTLSATVDRKHLGRRLMYSLGASSIGPACTAAIQLVSVPIFLRCWGADRYGEWLLLSALPSYLALSDFGFGSVAGSDMTMRVARGDIDGARKTYQSTCLFMLCVVLTVLALTALMVAFAPISDMLKLRTILPGEAHAVLIILSVYVTVCLLGSLLMSAYRSVQMFAHGMMFNNIIRLMDFVALTAAVLAHCSMWQSALAMMISRVVLTFASYRYLVHYASWLRVGFQHAHWRTVGDMTGAAFAFMAFPAGNAISIQGMLLVIGMTLGPAAVSAFSTMRTLTRVTTLMIDFAKGSIWGELSTAFGARDFALARRLHDGACQWTLWLSILSAGVMAMFGPWAYHMWTHGRTAFDLHVFYLLVLVSLADSLWIVSSITSVACNRHMPVSVTVIVSTLCAVGVAFVVAPHFGLAGAASSLFLIDVMMTYMVFRTSLRLLEHHVGAFVSRIARPPQLSSIVRQVRSIL